MHRTYVGRLERGESGVTVDSLAAILVALGVSLGEFFSPFTKVVRPRTPSHSQASLAGRWRRPLGRVRHMLWDFRNHRRAAKTHHHDCLERAVGRPLIREDVGA